MNDFQWRINRNDRLLNTFSTQLHCIYFSSFPFVVVLYFRIKCNLASMPPDRYLHKTQLKFLFIHGHVWLLANTDKISKISLPNRFTFHHFSSLFLKNEVAVETVTENACSSKNVFLSENRMESSYCLPKTNVTYIFVIFVFGGLTVV